MSRVEIITGDCRDVLATMPAASAQCCVTSPPYFGLRSYLPDGVRLKPDLSPEVRVAVLAELARSGILPLHDISE